MLLIRVVFINESPSVLGVISCSAKPHRASCGLDSMSETIAVAVELCLDKRGA